MSWQLPHCVDRSQESCNMGQVLIRRAVQVESLWLCFLQNVNQACHALSSSLLRLYFRACEGKLMHEAILSDFGCSSLFLSADLGHLGISNVGVPSIPRRACSVSARHAAEPQIILQVASRNSVESHKLNVVLMSTDGHVSASAVGL